MSCSMPAISVSAVGGGLVEPKSLIGSSEKITQWTPGCESTSRSNRDRALGPTPSVNNRLPLIPSLKTTIFRPSSASLAASIDGQLRPMPFVLPAPSVIEAPKATTAPTGAVPTNSPGRLDERGQSAPSQASSPSLPALRSRAQSLCRKRGFHAVPPDSACRLCHER